MKSCFSVWVLVITLGLSGCSVPETMGTIAITANAAATSFETSATADTKTPKTQPGGYYYDEYVYEGMKNLPYFLFGAGDYLYAVTKNYVNEQKYTYKIYSFDREAKLKKIYLLPSDNNEFYYDFYCDKDGKITVKAFIPDETDSENIAGIIYTYDIVNNEFITIESKETSTKPKQNTSEEFTVNSEVESFYDTGETDIMNLSVKDGSIYGKMRSGDETMLANKEVIEYSFLNRYDEYCDLQCGDFAFTDGYDIHIFRKTDKKHADLIEIKVGYTVDVKEEYEFYINAYNKAHDDFIAVPIVSDSPYNGTDVLVTSQFNKNYQKSVNDGQIINLYEFMDDGFFDEEKILMNLIRSNETDGKLYGFSPVWNFDVMTGNADTVKTGGFSSFEAMTKIEKSLYDEKSGRRLFSEDTNYKALGMIREYYITDYYDIINQSANIKASDLEALKKWALYYPTEEEYAASEDSVKENYTNLDYDGYSYTFLQFPPYSLSQFDVGYYRAGRYNAMIFNGDTLPQDYVYGNIFVNFSSFVNILYKGNYSLPGFWGRGSVMATPADFDTICVPKAVINTDGAESFISFILTEYQPNSYSYSLSVGNLERQAESAIGRKRTYEHGGKTSQYTIYYTNEDFIEIPDVKESEVMTLLNAIKYDSFSAQTSPYNNGYGNIHSLSVQGISYSDFLSGKESAKQLEKRLNEKISEDLTRYVDRGWIRY